MPNFENPPLSEPNIESKRKKKPKRAGIIPTAVLAVAALIGGEKAIAETEKTPINPAGKSKTVENAKQKSERQELFSPDARVDLATRIIADIDDINDLEQFIEDGIYSIEHPKGLTQGTMVVWGDESKHFDRARVGQPLEMALRFLTKNPNPEQWTNEEKAQAAIWLQAADNALQRVRDFNKQAQEMSPDELAKYNPDPIGLKKTMNSLQRSHEERRDEMSAKFRGQGFALKTTTERAEARALNGIPLETIIKLRQDIIEQNPGLFSPQATTDQYKKAIADILEKNKGYVDEMPDQDRILFAMIIDAALKSNPNAQETDFLPQPKITNEQIAKAVAKVTEDKKAQAEQPQTKQITEKEIQEEQAPKQMSDDELRALGDKILLDDSAFREAFPNLGLSNRALKQYQETTELLEQARQQNNAEAINELTKNQQEMLQMFQQRGRELLLAIQKELIRNFDVATEEAQDRDTLDKYINSEKFRKMSKNCQDAFFLLLYNYEGIKNLMDSAPEKQD